MGVIFDNYRKITKYPFGHFIFNKGIGWTAPFFGKIKPNVIELEPARCVVEMKDRRGIRNHIGTVNAGALCSLAELTAGMAVDAAIPGHLRWLPKAMTVSYLEKGKGTLKGKCEFDPELLQKGDVVIPMEIINKSNHTVFKADITFYISGKKS